MLVNDLKRVTEIDNKISDLHEELSNLYKLRVKCFDAGSIDQENRPAHKPSSPEPKTANGDWATKEYARLVSIWKKYNITLPAFKEMKNVLIDAETTISALSTARPELKNKLTTVIVPPAKLITPPKHDALRKKQDFINFADYFSPDISTDYRSKKWRVLVVYNSLEAISLGSADMILKNKYHMIENYDAGSLGVIEYIAFSLQQNQANDIDTWTLLVGDRRRGKNGLIPSVTFLDGQYRFETDEAQGWFGVERFRPAVEVGSITSFALSR